MRLMLTMKITSPEWEEFEIVDYTSRTFTIRSLKNGLCEKLPIMKYWEFKPVTVGRERLYAPSDIRLDREKWAIDRSVAVLPLSKTKKRKFFCRIYDFNADSNSFKHLTAVQICRLLNKGVDRFVEGDLREGVELPNGVRIHARINQTLWFYAPKGKETFDSSLDLFLKAVNRGTKAYSIGELRLSLLFMPDGSPCYVGQTDKYMRLHYRFEDGEVQEKHVVRFCAELNEGRPIAESDLRCGVCFRFGNGYALITKSDNIFCRFDVFDDLMNRIEEDRYCEKSELLEFVNKDRKILKYR